MLTEKCKGCYHNRRIYRDVNACHYSIDTDVLKDCTAKDCPHWISRADWCKQQGSTSIKMLYKRVRALFAQNMSLNEIKEDTGLTEEQILSALLTGNLEL